MRPSDRLNGLDHLRAFAISYVFIFHYAGQFKSPTWLAPIAKFGWSGVDLFFVLSGYLIGGQLLGRIASGQGLSIRDFYLQRFLRIIPVFWLVLALYFLLPATIEHGRLPSLWRFLTFTQNFALDNSVYSAFSHAWSLCVEEHFYLVLPCLITVFAARKWGNRGFLCGGLLMVLGVAIRGFCWTRVAAGDGGWYELVYYPTYCRLDGLIVGVAIAAMSLFYPRQWSWLGRKSYVLLFVGLALLYAGYALADGPYDFAFTLVGFPLVAIAYGCVVVAAVSPQSFLNRAAAITKRIAVLSYSIYLIHKIVIHLVQGEASSLHIAADGSIMFVLCITVSVACAYAMNVIVERPFLRLRERLAAPKSPALFPGTQPLS
ncbi:MAG: acyltransferase [Steroidobacteraceae bacterium]|jgi:peptidoglycan/LPS O-acetylase OafA/YrhL